MAVAFNQNLNRVVVAQWVAGDILTSHATVDMRIDPSQQYKITGLEFGYALIDADQTAFLAGNVFGYLDITIDPTQGSLQFAGLAPPFIGDLIFNWQITSVNDLWQQIRFEDPLIIEGNRRLTFIVGRPQTTVAATGPGSISLVARGDIINTEKPRLGDWSYR